MSYERTTFLSFIFSYTGKIFFFYYFLAEQRIGDRRRVVGPQECDDRVAWLAAVQPATFLPHTLPPFQDLFLPSLRDPVRRVFLLRPAGVSSGAAVTTRLT